MRACVGVHDIREKGIRGDDGTLNLTVSYNVVYDCGGAGPAYLSEARASGCGMCVTPFLGGGNGFTVKRYPWTNGT